MHEQESYRFVGQRVKRGDAPERLTGQTRFTNDLALPGALHARLVRSPYASANIVSIDKREALAIPGVVAVMTARDLPVPDIEGAVDSRTILLALDKVLHAGQPVAAVLAETEAAAEDGVSRRSGRVRGIDASRRLHRRHGARFAGGARGARGECRRAGHARRGAPGRGGGRQPAGAKRLQPHPLRAWRRRRRLCRCRRRARATSSPRAGCIRATWSRSRARP